MTENKNTESVKLCSSCQMVKPLIGGFYKAGPSWQKRCIPCHNKKRLDYTITRKPYKATLTGFKKLSTPLQKKIIYDIHIKINYRDIIKKYKTEYPKLKYQTLLSWKRAGQIPEYQPPSVQA